MSASEKLFERRLKIFVDFAESFHELLPRERIDFADRRLRVLNGFQQIFSLCL